MRPVLLATDGSTDARHAADHAVDLAAERGATLYVVCVVDDRRVGEPALSSAELATIYAEEQAATSVETVEQMAARRSVPVESDVRHGSPPEVIVEYANGIGATTIVIGEHGDHDVHMSGVGRKVASLADCEVVVVGSEPRPSPA